MTIKAIVNPPIVAGLSGILLNDKPVKIVDKVAILTDIATKTEIGNINSMLDIINGEVV